MTIRRALILYLGSEILLSTGIGVVLYIQPFYYESLGLSDALIGTLFAINSAVSGATAFFLGSVADRLGASHICKLATLLLPLGYLITGLSHAFWTLCAGAALSGFGASLLLCTENVVLGALLIGTDRAHVLSRFVALYTLVMAVGTAASGLLSQAVGTRDCLIIGAAISLCAPIIRVFVKVSDTKSQRLFRRPSKAILQMGVYALLFGCASGLFTPFANLILQGRYHTAAGVTATVSALALLMTAAGSFGVLPLLSRFGRPRTVRYSFVGIVVLSLTLSIGLPPTWAFVGLYLLRTAVTSVPGSIVDATFLEWTNPTMHVQMFGVRVFGNSMGSAVGSLMGGNLLTSGGIAAMLAGSALLFAAAFLYLRTLRAKQSGTPGDPDNSANDFR